MCPNEWLSNCQFLETKDSACAAVQRILNNRDSRFEVVPFENYNKTTKLRSQHYNGYFVLCHSNTLRSAGWLICRYVKNGGCCLERALFSFKTIQGGTSRLERHTASHINGTGTLRFQRQLPTAARKKIAQAAAMAVC